MRVDSNENNINCVPNAIQDDQDETEDCKWRSRLDEHCSNASVGFAVIMSQQFAKPIARSPKSAYDEDCDCDIEDHGKSPVRQLETNGLSNPKRSSRLQCCNNAENAKD